MVETGGDWSCEVVTGGGEGGFGDDNVRLKKSIMSSAFVVFNGGGGSVMVKAILNEGSDVGPTCAFECLDKKKKSLAQVCCYFMHLIQKKENLPSS